MSDTTNGDNDGIPAAVLARANPPVERLHDGELARLVELNNARFDAQLAYDEYLAKVRRKYRLYNNGDQINLKNGDLIRA